MMRAVSVVLRHVAVVLYRCGLVRSGPLYDRVRRHLLVEESGCIRAEVFCGCVPQWHDDGYWVLAPMPSQGQLARYYESAYWAGRGDKGRLLRERDVDHLLLLQEVMKGRVRSSRDLVAINFGAGHGGASFLFLAMGYQVTNLDPSGSPSIWPFRIVRDTPSATGPFDLIYASHSLEHVTSLPAVVAWVDAVLAPGGVLFVEVPNCRQTNAPAYENGGMDGVARPPHTYYFTMDYFRQLAVRLDLEISILGTYSYNTTGRAEALPDEDGDVIRFAATRPLRQA